MLTAIAHKLLQRWACMSPGRCSKQTALAFPYSAALAIAMRISAGVLKNRIGLYDVKNSKPTCISPITYDWEGGWEWAKLICSTCELDPHLYSISPKTNNARHCNKAMPVHTTDHFVLRLFFVSHTWRGGGPTS